MCNHARKITHLGRIICSTCKCDFGPAPERQPHMTENDIPRLVGELLAIHEHDWRVSHLACTSDVAQQAADTIVSLSTALSAANERERALREALELALKQLDNSDSPGGCDGEYHDCAHCEAIRRARHALIKAQEGE